VLQPLTVVLLVASGVLGLIAVHHLVRKRLIDDPLILTGAALEVGLVVQLVVGLTKASAISDGGERATFIAYLFTVLLVIPAAFFIAIKEKTQWAMAVVIGGAVVVAILIARLLQVWSLNA
jgi:nitrate reductase gamma subunit